MVLNWFVSLLRSFLNVFGLADVFFITSEDSSDKVVMGSNELTRVVVRTNLGKNVSVPVCATQTIADVKQNLAKELNIDKNKELRIILAGSELPDDINIGDSDIGNMTILHAIQVDISNSPKTADQGHRKGPTNQQLLDLQLTSHQDGKVSNAEDNRQKYKARFFIFCNYPCNSLQPGKLRVKCLKCAEGGIIVDRGPSDWSDVLDPPGKITGTCSICGPKSSVVFYFKCANHAPSVEETAPLYLIKVNISEVPCLACLSADSERVLVFDGCKHVICISCFGDLCRSKLGERQFILDPEYGYTLACPIGCEDSIIKETRHFKLMGDEAYERYQRFGAEEVVLQSGGVLCPQPNCGMGIMHDELCRKVSCSSCGYVFCRDCLQGFHVGECQNGLDNDGNCIQPTQRDFVSEGTRWIDPSAVTIRLKTKPCPKCRTPTERDGGCMHMICTKSACGFHWCWVCQTEWTRECMANHWFG